MCGVESTCSIPLGDPNRMMKIRGFFSAFPSEARIAGGFMGLVG